jgi:aminopeptidase YwaD
VNAQPNTAAWAVSPKAARELETMLNRGQKVTIRSITKSEQVPNKQEIVHAEIPGDGSTTQEVAIGGHLFEAYIKQGAHDDNSGCALTLEIGRAYLKRVAEGKAPCHVPNGRSTSSGSRRSAARTPDSMRTRTSRRSLSAI